VSTVCDQITTYLDSVILQASQLRNALESDNFNWELVDGNEEDGLGYIRDHISEADDALEYACEYIGG
jgi:hypothetical protein